MKAWPATILVALLGACGSVPQTPLKEQEAILDAKPLCCEDFRGVSYEPLRPKTPTRAVLDSTAPARLFPQGRSYFRAFSLAPGESQGVWIKSYFNGMFIKQYLQPVVMFLDNDYRPLGIAVPWTHFQEGNMFGDSNARMEGGVRVPPTAKYMLVFTAPFTEGPDAARTAPSTGVLMIGNTPVLVPSPGKTIELERSKSGELSLELERLPN